MLKTIKKLTRYFRYYMRYFGYYPVTVVHYADGFDDYDRDLYAYCENDINKIVTKLKRKGLMPRIGDVLLPCVNEDPYTYYVKEIWYYKLFCTVLVDEDRNRHISY